MPLFTTTTPNDTSSDNYSGVFRLTAFNVLYWLTDDARAWTDIYQYIPSAHTELGQCYKLFMNLANAKGLR